MVLHSFIWIFNFGIIWVCDSNFSTINLMKSNTDQIFPMKILYPNWDIKYKIHNGFRKFSTKHVKCLFNNMVLTSWSFSFFIHKKCIPQNMVVRIDKSHTKVLNIWRDFINSSLAKLKLWSQVCGQWIRVIILDFFGNDPLWQYFS